MFLILIVINLMATILFTSLFWMLYFPSTKSISRLSPFECGFLPFYKSRQPFTLRFFIILMIFLLFDMEIILVIPLPLMSYTTTTTSYSISLLLLLILYGLIHEWSQGKLKWT